VVRTTSKITAVDQPNTRRPLAPVIGPIRLFGRSDGTVTERRVVHEGEIYRVSVRSGDVGEFVERGPDEDLKVVRDDQGSANAQNVCTARSRMIVHSAWMLTFGRPARRGAVYRFGENGRGC
jgi:hypothetical protein